MTDILLIIPASIDEFTRHEVPPLGICYIAACLQQKGYTVKILDFVATPMKKDRFMEYLAQEDPKIIGISSLVTIHNNGCRLAKLIKEHNPEIPVIMGGSHATCIVKQVLKTGYIDVVVRFEGELTFTELVEYYLEKYPSSLAEIKGIAFMNGEQITVTAERELIKDLDALPLPARELIDLSTYERAGSIITGRGCVFTCKFCAANYLCGGRYRLRSVDRVIDEMELLYRNYGVEEIFLLDDTFVLNHQRIYEFCDKLITKNLPIQWCCTSRVNPPIPFELLQYMKKAGCRKIGFGVESGNNEILKCISKGITVEMVEQSVLEAHEASLVVTCYFIIGFPEDTDQSVRDTLGFANKLREIGTEECPVYTTFGIMTPLPGTYYWEHAEELGIKFLSQNWDNFKFTEPVIETRNLSKEQLKGYLFETLVVS